MNKDFINQLRRMEIYFSRRIRKHYYNRYSCDLNSWKNNCWYRNNDELKYRYKDIKSIFDLELHGDEVNYNFPVRLTKRKSRWNKSYKQYIKACSKYIYELARKEGYSYKQDLIWPNLVALGLSFTFTKLPTSQTILNRLVESEP